MIAPRARRINIPLRHVTLMCGGMLFALLANVTYLQALDSERLNEDPRNRRTMIARFEDPRGRILLRDGTVIATSRRSRSDTYRYRRAYPGGPLYAPLTGHFSLYGAGGLEQAEDDLLSGNDPRVRVRGLVDGTRGGATLRLTVDRDAQRAAYDGLRATGLPGAVVAIDPRTGAVLAMVSLPSYNPNRYASFNAARLDRADKRFRGDPDDPLVNRSIQRTYPSGSTFKIVTGAAALASGRYDPGVTVNVPASLRLPGTRTYLRDRAGAACGAAGTGLLEAFRSSCDTPFAKLGIELGPDALRERAEAFGFDTDDLEIPMPVTRSVYPAPQDDARTALSALGGAGVRVTPLMTAMIAAAVANDGLLMRPHLVEDVRLADDTVIERAEPSPYRRVFGVEEAGRLTEMMVAVTGPGGTGTAAAVPGVKVAAVTGSAENAPLAVDHALFTGFAPAAAPRVAVGVLVEGGGEGGRVAAPIARAVIEAALVGQVE
ncbi:penicillin-binding transpeptidase domain-containing protein [Streptosporangium sp. NPDC023615]|uniref:penicillin-binding transpeptidase domain-containing protein n=1 Tax=Streptosporangium sp. NPDC023615 TaxID=3154794 RepID=UPI00343806DF